MVFNLYLKFSKLQFLEGEAKTFGHLYGVMASAILKEFLSSQEIIVKLLKLLYAIRNYLTIFTANEIL